MHYPLDSSPMIPASTFVRRFVYCMARFRITAWIMFLQYTSTTRLRSPEQCFYSIFEVFHLFNLRAYHARCISCRT